MKSEIGFDGFVRQPIPNEKLLVRLFGTQQNLTIFDIGSCEGEDSIRYARFFPNSKIHAFEPIPKNLKAIEKNINRYDLQKRITANSTALSNKNGEAEIFVSSGQPKDVQSEGEWDYGNKSSSLLPPEEISKVTPWLSFKKKLTIQTKTLDNYCKTKRIDSIDLIHMDVQGAELMVLEGAKKIIKHTKAIWLEVENVELYKGQPLKEDIEKFMKTNQFVRMVDSVNDVAGDQLYVSKQYLSYSEKKTFNTKLSVIIPTYNRSESIVAAINSVLDQTSNVKSLEILVIDDGSTDNTEEIVEKLNLKEVSYHRIEHSGKPAIARNCGIKKSSGELVAFLDSDDSWTSNKLRDQLPFFEDDSTMLVYGQARTKQTKLDLINPEVINGGENFTTLLKTNVIANSSVIIRRTALDKVGGFNIEPELEVEDYHLWLKVSLAFPNGIRYCGSTVLLYSDSSSSDRISTVSALQAAKRILYAHSILKHIPDLSDKKRQAIDNQIINDHRHILYLQFNQHTPLISVVMSVYNGQGYLRSAIDSILAQTYRDFEFIIINDGSTDATLDILSSYNDPRIYIVNQENKGLVASLNTGCQIASGTYIARMDADDISMPSRFERQLNLLTSSPDMTLVGTFFSYLHEDGIPTGVTMTTPTLNIDIRRALYTVNPFAHGSTMYKKEPWKEAGGYTDTYGPTEDYELWGRLAGKTNHTFGIVPESLYLYRLNSQGISSTKSAIQAKFSSLIAQEQWDRPFAGKSVREIIKDGRYYISLHPILGDEIFGTYYYQNIRIMQHLFLTKHFLTGLKQSIALLWLKPDWSRKLIFRSIVGGFLRKLGVKK